MSDRPLVIFGAGELAHVAAYYFEKDTSRRIAAFTVDGAHLREAAFAGHEVIAFEEVASRHGPESHDLFVAVGYSRINLLRQEKCAAAVAMGYQLASYVSSRATVFDNVKHGWNCFILEDNTVQPFVRIGNGVTLWSGNHIGHHASIGDFCFISSHVVISGGVTVGERSFIGVNSTVNDHVSIGARCVIGSASLITKPLPDESVVSAEPGRISPVPSSRLRGF
jgi:sugar O-acyltransferase (sialic acid O-acetyltransferase NeuD family)